MNKKDEMVMSSNFELTTIEEKQFYEDVKKILSMKEWEDEKFESLLTPNIWHSNYQEIKKILGMPEWNNKKFEVLLTSNIWKSNYESIRNILSMEEWNDKKFEVLLTSNIWTSNYKTVQNVLRMKEWNDKRFEHLLTSNIWKGNYENIKNILHMEEWEESKYKNLLTSSILILSPNKIRASINLATKLNIEDYIGVNFIRKSLKQVYAIAMYLNNLKIPLVGENGKLNPFFVYETTVLKKRYNIDLKELVKMYPMKEDFLKKGFVK